ncbi:MAG TPA: hypothetical protein VFV61_02835, partial [Pyrinomonadaceae bacterium]|nr:hypothetical protein [Pyrinomonadaceae bacterium]
MKIFFNNAGRLRSGWRVLIFAGLFVAVLFALSTLLRFAYALLINLAPSLTPNSYFENVIYRFLFTAAALLAGYICTRGLEGLPWRALGLPLHRNWLRQLLIGSMIGVGSLALAALIATAG